ncbi:MAG: hypothetical protein V1749_01490 [Candidatus Desantisbacteria bacterium]
MNETTLGILCGTMIVMLQIVVGGIYHNRWLPSLRSMVEIFSAGASLPFGIALFCFAIGWKSQIDIEQCKLYIVVAVIVIFYIAICKIIEEINTTDK